jgi:hypothetical protein
MFQSIKMFRHNFEKSSLQAINSHIFMRLLTYLEHDEKFIAKIVMRCVIESMIIGNKGTNYMETCTTLFIAEVLI